MQKTDDRKALLEALPTMSKPPVEEVVAKAIRKPAKAQTLRGAYAASSGLSDSGGDVRDGSKPAAHRLAQQYASSDATKPRYKQGARIVREWKGEVHEVAVTPNGYEYRGEIYRSLSPIANRITGTRWSRPAFFGAKPLGRRK